MERLPKESVLNLTLDVSDLNEDVYNTVVEMAVKKFGRIDVLVNNAGYGAITNFEETSEETIRRLFEVNVFGLMRVTRAVLSIMRQQRSGHIFNISSGAGYSAGPAPYHTSKFAVTEFHLNTLQYKQEHNLSCTQTAMHFCFDVVTVCRWDKKFREKGVSLIRRFGKACPERGIVWTKMLFRHK